jgi:hypothetical protein
MDKERVEILLEKIDGDVRGIAEGHGLLRKEMQEMRTEFRSEFDDVKSILKFHSGELKFLSDELKSVSGELKSVSVKVDGIDRKLDKHILQPSHA